MIRLNHFYFILICVMVSFSSQTALAVGPVGNSANEMRTLQKSNLDSKLRSQLPDAVPDATASPMQDDTSAKPVSIERAVVDAFLKDDCARILKLVPEQIYGKVSGRVLALVASCSPNGKDPDKMFAHARDLSPNDTSILLLHARYQSQKQMVSSNDLWQLLLTRTKDPKVVSMAELYLQGDAEAADKILLDRPASIGGFFQGGVIFEENPSLISLSQKDAMPLRPSTGLTSAGLLKYSKPSGVGSNGLDYFFSQSSYSRSHESDVFIHELGLPMIANATKDAAIILRPYVNQTLLGSKAYVSDLGAVLTRADSFDGLNQTISAQVYSEHYFESEDQPQQGTHFKFEYGLHPRGSANFDLDMLLYIDHASAGEDNSNAAQKIPYSNFTYGAFFAAVTKGRVAFGLNTVLAYRVDDSQSNYIDNVSQNNRSKQREDFTFQAQPFVVVGINAKRTLELVTAYQFTSVNSNLGATDYLDRNSVNQTISMTFRYIFDR